MAKRNAKSRVVPKTVVINGRKWRVVRERLSDAMGLCDFRTRTITLHTDIDGDDLLDTVIHEVLHACAWDTPAMFGAHEEIAIEVLAPKLLGALKSFGMVR